MFPATYMQLVWIITWLSYFSYLDKLPDQFIAIENTSNNPLCKLISRIIYNCRELLNIYWDWHLIWLVLTRCEARLNWHGSPWQPGTGWLEAPIKQHFLYFLYMILLIGSITWCHWWPLICIWYNETYINAIAWLVTARTNEMDLIKMKSEVLNKKQHAVNSTNQGAFKSLSL